MLFRSLALGIEKLNAQPAVVELMLSFPEDIIIANMVNNRITLDKDMQLFINGYEYHLDYDVVITRTKLLNGEYVYTAQYDIKRKNPISNITNPYLPPIGRIMITNTPMISVEVQMHQVEYTKVYKKNTFPTNRQLKTFIKTRLDPVLAKGYYSTLISDKDNTQEQKKIRNSFLIFRSSSKAGAVEGKLSMPL